MTWTSVPRHDPPAPAGLASVRFAVADEVPGPVTVATGPNGEAVIVLRRGAVVDDALVEMIDQLARPPDRP